MSEEEEEERDRSRGRDGAAGGVVRAPGSAKLEVRRVEKKKFTLTHAP
jgi:hypothetical protein